MTTKMTTEFNLSEIAKALEKLGFDINAIAARKGCDFPISEETEYPTLESAAKVEEIIKKVWAIVNSDEIWQGALTEAREVYNKIAASLYSSNVRYGQAIDLSKIKGDANLVHNIYHMRNVATEAAYAASGAVENVVGKLTYNAQAGVEGEDMMTPADLFWFLADRKKAMMEGWKTRKAEEKEKLSAEFDERLKRVNGIIYFAQESARECFARDTRLTELGDDDARNHSYPLLKANIDLISAANQAERILNGLRLSQYFSYKFGRVGLHNSIFAVALLKLLEYATKWVPLLENYKFFDLRSDGRFYALAGEVLRIMYPPKQLVSILRTSKSEDLDKLISFTALHVYVAAIYYNDVVSSLYKPEAWAFLDRYTYKPEGYYAAKFVELAQNFFYQKVNYVMAKPFSTDRKITPKMEEYWDKITERIMQIKQAQKPKPQQPEKPKPKEIKIKPKAVEAVEQKETIPVSDRVERDKSGRLIIHVCAFEEMKGWEPRYTDKMDSTITVEIGKFTRSNFNANGFFKCVTKIGEKANLKSPVALAYCYKIEDEGTFVPFDMTRIVVTEKAYVEGIGTFAALPLFDGIENRPTCKLVWAYHAFSTKDKSVYILAPAIFGLLGKKSDSVYKHTKDFMSIYIRRFPDKSKYVTDEEVKERFVELSNNSDQVNFF